MKRTYILLILSIAFLQAQDSLKFDFVVNLGINASYVEGVACQKYEPHRYPGFQFGLAIEKENKFSDFGGIEISFEGRGGIWGARFFEPVDGDYVIYNLNYISLTPYYRLKSNIGHLFQNFYVILGTPISLLTYARQKWVIEWSGPYDDETDYPDTGPKNLLPELNKTEIGLKYGLSFPYFGHLAVEFIFYQAITKLYKSGYEMHKDDLNNKDEFRNNSFTVRLSYRF